MSEFPKIVTFYSFKGGVGRSMAVLNTAYALAARGRHVLVLDMDLEAPGLSGFLRRENEIDGTGRQDMVDLIGWASDAARMHDSTDESAKVAFPPLSDYIVNVPPEKIQDVGPESGSLGRLDIIPVDEQHDYYGRLTGLNIGGFDRDALLRTGSLLRSYLKSRVVTQEVPDYCTARGNLAIALLVSGRTDEAFDAYEGALALADEKAISDMESDLRTAMADNETLSGADQALERLEARREQIEAPESK